MSAVPLVAVYDTETDEVLEVPVTEAAAGMVLWARQQLGAGTPACAVWEQRAAELLRSHGYR